MMDELHRSEPTTGKFLENSSPRRELGERTRSHARRMLASSLDRRPARARHTFPDRQLGGAFGLATPPSAGDVTKPHEVPTATGRATSADLNP